MLSPSKEFKIQSVVSEYSGVAGFQDREIIQLREVIERSMSALRRGELSVSGVEERSNAELIGFLQLLKNIQCETQLSLMQTDLWAAIKDHLHQPKLQALVVHLLEGLVVSKSALSSQAQ